MTEILKSFEKAKTLKGKPNAFGKANVIRFREEKEAFVDAFESKLASNYQSEKEDVCALSPVDLWWQRPCGQPIS